MMDAWYRVVVPRKEVRQGRSFNPDEFAIALEQVVAGTAPEDYRDPVQFFSRTCFTRALREHAGMALRRLAGHTENTAPVLTLITQFGFPDDSAAIPDTPRLTLVVARPAAEWNGGGAVRESIAAWTRQRGKSPRLYPAALIWCVRKPGRDLRDRVELWLAWRRVQRDLVEGVLGADFDRAERADIQARVADAEQAARDEVWAGYRFVVLADARAADGLRVIDLGAGHSSAAESLCDRVIAALKSEALLNDSVGAGYLERNWPPALKASGAWPLSSLRQAFLNGALTRLLDPDAVLRARIVDLVARGELGLASGQRADGTYDRIWFDEPVAADEILFESDVFLLTKTRAQALKAGSPAAAASPTASPDPPPVAAVPPAGPLSSSPAGSPTPSGPVAATRTLRLVGTIPPEVWNRLGTRVLPRLRGGADVRVGIEFSVTLGADAAAALETDLRQALEDLGLAANVRIEVQG